MKNRVMFFVIAGAILAIAGAMCIPQAHAPSHTTVEDDSLRVVSVATEIFVGMNGRPPRSWEDLGPRIRLEAVDRDMVSAHGFRFRDRYQFVTQPMPMSHGDDKGNQVILVRVIPFKDYRQRGEAFRSFVYMDSDRRVSPSRISEERAQELFKTYGITIPVPPGLPAIETDVNRTKLQVLWAGLAAIVAGVAAWLFVRSHKPRKWGEGKGRWE